MIVYAVVNSSEQASDRRGSAGAAEVGPTPTLSGRVQLSLPDFTPVIIHPVARESPASNLGAAAEAPTPEDDSETAGYSQHRESEEDVQLHCSSVGITKGLVTLADGSAQQTIASQRI